MICFKCDRCGEIFDWREEDSFNGIRKIKTEKDGITTMTAFGEVNLCPACMDALGDWLKKDSPKCT